MLKWFILVFIFPIQSFAITPVDPDSHCEQSLEFPNFNSWMKLPRISVQDAEAAGPIDIVFLQWSHAPREIEGLLTSEWDFVREAAAGQLYFLPTDERSSKLIAQSINDSNWNVRKQAFESYLSWLKRNIHPLPTLLYPLPAALKFVGGYLGRSSVESDLKLRLRTVLQSQTAEEIQTAFKGMDTETKHYLIRLATEANDELPGSIPLALEESANNVASAASGDRRPPILYDIKREPPREVRYQSRSSIDFRADPNTVGSQVQNKSARIIGPTFIPTKLTKEEIYLALKYPDVSVQVSASRSLPMEVNDDLDLELWRIALAHKEFEVQFQALELLNRFDRPQVSGTLIGQVMIWLVSDLNRNTLNEMDEAGYRQLGLQGIYAISKLLKNADNADAFGLSVYEVIWSSPYRLNFSWEAILSLSRRQDQLGSVRIARILEAKHGSEWSQNSYSDNTETRRWLESLKPISSAHDDASNVVPFPRRTDKK